MLNIEPVAQALLTGRTFAQDVAALHMGQFRWPLTVMGKAHTMRSAIQAQVALGHVDGFELDDGYLSFGRVEIIHTETGTRLLLKSRTMYPVEAGEQGTLFDFIKDEPIAAPSLTLLLYKLERDYMTLATVAAEPFRANGRLRFQTHGRLNERGRWYFAPPSDGPDGRTEKPVAPFDQGDPDDFGDISDDVRFLGEGGL